MFVAYADAGITTVLQCLSNPLYAAHGTGLFAILGAFVAHFTSRAVRWSHMVFVGVVITEIGFSAYVQGFLPVVISMTFVLISSIICNGVIALHSQYTAAVQATMRAQFNASLLDPLTGVLNRRGFYYRMGLQPRNPSCHLALVALVDIDNFKAINDLVGHAAGDQVLRQVATVLQSSVPDGSLIARLGGDEFAIVSFGSKAEIDSMISTLAEPDFGAVLFDGSRAATVTVGTVWGQAPAAGESCDSDRAALLASLLASADRALRAKKEGREMR